MLEKLTVSVVVGVCDFTSSRSFKSAHPRSEILTRGLGKFSGLVITRKKVLIGLVDDDRIPLNPDRQCVSISFL